jgi:hypothetical protein
MMFFKLRAKQLFGIHYSCGFGLGFIPYPQNKNCKISALTTPKPCNLSKPKSTEIANELADLLNF